MGADAHRGFAIEQGEVRGCGVQRGRGVGGFGEDFFDVGFAIGAQFNTAKELFTFEFKSAEFHVRLLDIKIYCTVSVAGSERGLISVFAPTAETE